MKYPVAMIVLLAAPLVSAPPPRLVREINLNQIIPARPDSRPSVTFAFSPDEKWMAVAVGDHQTQGARHSGGIIYSRLLLVPLNGAAGQPVQIDPGLLPFSNPAWSPDSATVLLQGIDKLPPSPSQDGIAKLWNLRGDEILSRRGPGFTGDAPVGGVFGFLDSKHLLARRMPAKRMPPAFETIDLQGQVVDTWTVPKHWAVADISPERGFVAILTERSSKTLVIDHASRKVILSRSNPSGYQPYSFPSQISPGGSWQFFTERGKTLCSVGSVGTGNPQFDTTTECWDVDSGRKIAEFKSFRGGAPAAASSHGSRLVLTREIAFPGKGDGLTFPGGNRVAWDFCSDAEVAAWEVPDIVGPVAISSSGRYVAETDGSLIRIYQLP